MTQHWTVTYSHLCKLVIFHVKDWNYGVNQHVAWKTRVPVSNAHRIGRVKEQRQISIAIKRIFIKIIYYYYYFYRGYYESHDDLHSQPFQISLFSMMCALHVDCRSDILSHAAHPVYNSHVVFFITKKPLCLTSKVWSNIMMLLFSELDIQDRCLQRKIFCPHV